MSKQGVGVLLTLIAGIAWGISGISGQYLLSHGLNINALSSIRLLISGICLLGVVAISDFAKVRAALRDKEFLVTMLIFSLLWFGSQSIRLSKSHFLHQCWDSYGLAVHGTRYYHRFSQYQKTAVAEMG